MKNKIKQSKSLNFLEIINEEPLNYSRNIIKKNRSKTTSSLSTNQLNYKKNKLNIIKSDHFMSTISTDIKDKNNKLNHDKEDEANNKTKNIFQKSKSHSLICFNSNNNNNKNEISNLNINNNLYLTCVPLNLLIKEEQKYKTLENEKIKINKPKRAYKINKTSIFSPKKINSIDEIIKEKEKEFDENNKQKKSFKNYLNNFYKKEHLYEQKNIDEFKKKYIYIKSNLMKETKSSHKRDKINLEKIKEYSLFKNKFNKEYKFII